LTYPRARRASAALLTEQPQPIRRHRDRNHLPGSSARSRAAFIEKSAIKRGELGPFTARSAPIERAEELHLFDADFDRVGMAGGDAADLDVFRAEAEVTVSPAAKPAVSAARISGPMRTVPSPTTSARRKFMWPTKSATKAVFGLR